MRALSAAGQNLPPRSRVGSGSTLLQADILHQKQQQEQDTTSCCACSPTSLTVSVGPRLAEYTLQGLSLQLVRHQVLGHPLHSLEASNLHGHLAAAHEREGVVLLRRSLAGQLVNPLRCLVSAGAIALQGIEYCKSQRSGSPQAGMLGPWPHQDILGLVQCRLVLTVLAWGLARLKFRRPSHWHRQLVKPLRWLVSAGCSG